VSRFGKFKRCLVHNVCSPWAGAGSRYVELSALDVGGHRLQQLDTGPMGPCSVAATGALASRCLMCAATGS
jgi:hypothetical protein